MTRQPESAPPCAPLDWLNFFLADVRDGLAPFLAVWLLTARHWDEARIGLVLTVMGLAGLLAQTPAGAWIDRTRAKRSTVVAAAAVVAVTTMLVTLVPSFWVVLIAKGAMGAAASVFAPALAAISLGLVGQRWLAARIGRNEAFNHAGNVMVAVLAGLAGWLIAPAAPFWLVAITAGCSVVAVLAIDPRRIDHRAARGLADGRAVAEQGDQPSGLQVILTCRPLLVFTLCFTLFHLANAAMLPLISQKLALGHAREGSLFAAACITVAQLVMVPMALLVGRHAERWGRKPLLLAAFAVLPLRGVLFALAGGAASSVAVQALDGVGAGILGALFPVVLADLTRGTGRYNLAQGAVTTVQGGGAALSTALAGLVAARLGYDSAFLLLAGIGGAALLLLLILMPETREPASARDDEDHPAAARI